MALTLYTNVRDKNKRRGILKLILDEVNDFILCPETYVFNFRKERIKQLQAAKLRYCGVQYLKDYCVELHVTASKPIQEQIWDLVDVLKMQNYDIGVIPFYLIKCELKDKFVLKYIYSAIDIIEVDEKDNIIARYEKKEK